MVVVTDVQTVEQKADLMGVLTDSDLVVPKDVPSAACLGDQKAEKRAYRLVESLVDKLAAGKVALLAACSAACSVCKLVDLWAALRVGGKVVRKVEMKAAVWDGERLVGYWKAEQYWDAR